VEDFSFCLPFFVDSESAAGDGQLKASRSAGTRIEVEDAFVMSNLRLVGVAEQDRSESGCGGIKVQLVHIVQEVQFTASKAYDLGLRQLRARTMDIDVAANGRKGSNGGERFKDRRITYVPKVQDGVRPIEQRQHLRTKQAMCVGNDSKDHSEP
jgi:hypothetical protein